MSYPYENAKCEGLVKKGFMVRQMDGIVYQVTPDGREALKEYLK